MPLIDTRERVVRWRRLLAGGVLLTVLAGAVGAGLELWWFGPTDASAARRVERDVHERFAAMVRSITEASARVTTDARAAAGLAAGLEDAGRRALFDLAAETRARSELPAEIAITIYDKAIVARAWSGASSDIPDDRIAGPSTLFVTPSPLGLRLVHLQPIAGSDGPRLGSVASEHVLSPAPAATTLTPTDYTLQTSLGPASLRTRLEGAGDLARPGAVVLRAPSGEPLAEAWVDPETLRGRAQSLATAGGGGHGRAAGRDGAGVDRPAARPAHRPRPPRLRPDDPRGAGLDRVGWSVAVAGGCRRRQSAAVDGGDAAARRRHGGRAREPARRSGRPPADRVAWTAALHARGLGPADRHATVSPASASPR